MVLKALPKESLNFLKGRYSTMTKSKLLVALLAIALVFSFSTAAFAEAPALIVTGTGLVGGATADDLGDNVINEIAYSLDELKAINTEEHFYSAINSKATQSIFKAQGIAISLLLQKSGYNAGGEITLIADDGWEAKINLNEERFYFPTFSADNKVAAPALLAWAEGGERGVATEPTSVAPIEGLKSYIGQLAPDVINQNSFVSGVVKIVVGEELPAVFDANGIKMTRAEVMALGHDEATYTYNSSKGETTDNVKGVYLADLLGDSIADDAVLTFNAADGWDGIAEYDITYAEAKANKYMLAYEKEKAQKGWQGIYNGAGGYFVLYGEGIKPAKFVDGVSAALPAPVAPPAAEGKTIVLTIGSKTAVVNGAEVAMDVMPEVVTVNGGGVTFVPVRFVTEQLGLVNNWNAAAPQDVNLVGEGFAGKITIGSVNATINGEAKTLLAPPYATEGRTMVPLRFLSENLGYAVNYDPATQIITIK